jgi:hypothetical protein
MIISRQPKTYRSLRLKEDRRSSSRISLENLETWARLFKELADLKGA